MLNENIYHQEKRGYYSIVKEMIGNQVHVVADFLSQTDVPAWYRGQSLFQMQACDSLFNALRDDSEQQTSHRVRRILVKIGLTPLPDIKAIKKMMRVSRGNDLAFLYFLMEMYFKTPGEEYSINEQLIMSSIMHLDMVITLRELDRLLPPSSMSKKEWLKRLEAEKLKQKKPKPKGKRPEYVLPYFEKLARPKIFGKPLEIPIPDFKVSFAPYDCYKDPNYVVQNESNRWYASYKLQPNKRIAYGIVKEALDEMFCHYHRISGKDEAEEILCEPHFNSLYDLKPACQHHRAIQALEQSLEDKLKVIAKERCLQYFDVHKRSREKREECVKERLEKDVNRYMAKFRLMAQKTKDQIDVMTITGDNDWVYHLADKCPKEGQKTKDQIEVMTFSDFCDCQQHLVNTNELVCEDEKRDDNNTTQPERSIAPEKMVDPKINSIPEKDVRASKGRVSIITNELADERSENLQQEENSQQEVLKDEFKTTPSKMYFHSPTKNKPYLFDYRKIFGSLQNDTNKMCVKHSIVNALDSEADPPPAYLSDSQVDVDAAVDDCARKMFTQDLAAKDTKNSMEVELAIEASEEETPKIEELEESMEPISTLSYNVEYFDPEDKEMMDRMLKDAFGIIKQNPKFILATFPEVHKLPIFREWIYQRYGKLYTKQERFKSFQRSTKIFEVIGQTIMDVQVPKMSEVGGKEVLNYDCRNYYIRKFAKIKRDYYKRLDSAILRQARIFWFAMKPLLCSNGPPRNTYFAYMPAHLMDITHVGVWEAKQFRDIKSAWEARTQYNE